MKIGKLPLVPYHRPGDPHLGDAIRGLAAKHSAVLLANHGPVVSGTNLESAVYAMEELEETAKLFLLLPGHNPRVLTPAPIDEMKTPFKRSEERRVGTEGVSTCSTRWSPSDKHKNTTNKQ